MNENREISVATPETLSAFKEEISARYSTKAEVDSKISSAELGGVSLTPITAEEIHAMFAADDSAV